MRSNVRGNGLAGTTHLALLAAVREGLAIGFETLSWLARLRRLLDAMGPEPIGRQAIVSQFRWALVPPAKVGGTCWHLSLNVSFDSGRESGMRVIYRDLGPLLDALLCHCEGYPGSRTGDFDTYCRWLRSAELDGGNFCTGSPAMRADEPGPGSTPIVVDDDRDDVTDGSEDLRQALVDAANELPLHLRTLAGLYRLTGFWSGADGDILLRFAQMVLRSFLDTMKVPAFAHDPAVQAQLKPQFADAWAWLQRAPSEPVHEERLAWDPLVLQGTMLDEGPCAPPGALVLLRVSDAEAAAAHLSGLAPRCAPTAAVVGQVRLHIAFTMAGLRALQIHPVRLELLPPEFHEGMEARAGLLGDRCGNHPDHWRRPLRHGVDPAHEDRIDLGVVHVAILMRTLDQGQAGHGLHRLLAAEVAALGQPGTGLKVLACEATCSRGIDPPVAAAVIQPEPRQHPLRPGEPVLGSACDRGDGPLPADSDALLDRASFLVVRKLRHRLDPLGADAPAEADRGTLWMACCASIAEQFESVPRDGDAPDFRGLDADGAVPRDARSERAFVELLWGLYLFVPALAALQRLGDFRHAPPPLPRAKTTVAHELEAWRARLEDRDQGRATWAWVREAHAGVFEAPAYGRLLGTAAPVFEALADVQCTKVSVQGVGERMAASVGIHHLGMDPDTGHTAVAAVVNPVVAAVDEARAFAGALGVARTVLADFAQAGSGPFALRHPDGRLRLAVDLIHYSEQVIGALARQWFGLPDGVHNGKHMAVGGRFPAPDSKRKPRCPGHLVGPSRMIFDTHPPDAVEAEGEFHGPMVLAAVRDALKAGLAPGTGQLTDPLRGPLATLGGALGPELLEREVAGLLLGFAPIVQGNFLAVMKQWIQGGHLWALQQQLADSRLAGEKPLAAAQAALRRPLLDTMQHEPVPAAVWRCPVVKGRPDPQAPPVVLGLASAIHSLASEADPARRDALLFGGDYFAGPASDRWGVHACPGSKMGLGVMLAMAYVLLDAGTLRPTGSPMLLMLTPKLDLTPATP